MTFDLLALMKRAKASLPPAECAKNLRKCGAHTWKARTFYSNIRLFHKTTCAPLWPSLNHTSNDYCKEWPATSATEIKRKSVMTEAHRGMDKQGLLVKNQLRKCTDWGKLRGFVKLSWYTLNCLRLQRASSCPPPSLFALPQRYGIDPCGVSPFIHSLHNYCTLKTPTAGGENTPHWASHSVFFFRTPQTLWWSAVLSMMM